MTTSTPSGLDLRWIDPAVRPQDDLFAHLNGVYLREHEIPADRAQDGAFRHLRDRAEADVRAIVEEAAHADDPDAQQIAALYASFMDVERVEALGVTPLQPAARRDRGGAGPRRARRRARPPPAAGPRVADRHVRLHGREELQPLPRAPEPVRPGPAGRVVLPRRRPTPRSAPPTSLTSTGSPSWWASTSPPRLAEQVMELETALAAASWDRVTNRDAEKTYTLMTAPRCASAPGFDWERLARGLGAPEGAFAEIVVRQPSFVEAAAALWARATARAVEGVAALRTASACADFLSDAVVEENFAFYGRTLSGTPRAARALEARRRAGRARSARRSGKLYVERHFPPAPRSGWTTSSRTSSRRTGRASSTLTG